MNALPAPLELQIDKNYDTRHRIILCLVISLCLLPLFFPFITALHANDVLASAARIDQQRGLTDLPLSGCSISANGADIVLFILTIMSITILAWRFTLRHRSHSNQESI